ncbi:MAG TPA: DEAD/DEAH box helicase family protein [Isosphaeraceae bacterium]|nr:DEAD/DEAH box helicase family protein [Isosphaeraceae bacterium]
MICLTEAAPEGRRNRIEIWLRDINDSSKPGLNRLAMKMATGSGKTVVMAMLTAWNALNKQLAQLYDLALSGLSGQP